VFKAIIAVAAVVVIALLTWYTTRENREKKPFVPDGVRLVCGRCGYRTVGPVDTLVCPRCGNYLDVSVM